MKQEADNLRFKYYKFTLALQSLAARLKNDRARELIKHGVSRRLMLLHRCVDIIFDFLRGFLRHHRELFADLGRLLYGLLCRYFCQAAGMAIRTAMVSSHQSFGEFASWNPRSYYLLLLSSCWD
jgi:hypothetical protein